MNTPEIVNAKITSTMLGVEDHGIFTAYLYLEWEGAGVAFGGYGIDEWVEKLKRRRDIRGSGLEFIRAIMNTVGVDKWEDLTGQYIRLEVEGWGGKSLRIGNLIKDRWFDPKAFFEAEKQFHETHHESASYN